MIRVTASAELWAAVLAELGARLRALPAGVHARWLAPLGQADGTPAAAGRWQDFAAFLGIGTATLAELGDATLRLALLPARPARRALLLRGLLARSGQVRRCIDPRTRAALVAETGPAAWKALTLEAAAGAFAPLGAAACADAPLPPPDQLAWEGLQCFAAAPQWQDSGALARLWRLQFPPDMPESAPPRANPEAQQWVLRRLAIDEPELPPWCTCAGPNWALNWA